MNSLPPSLSVIVCATAKQSWDSFTATLGSIQKQSVPATELIVVVDHNLPLLERAAAAYPHLKIIPNNDVRGMSGSRHTGLQTARGRVIAFLEGDEIAQPNWLTDLVSVYNAAYTTGNDRVPLVETVAQRKVS